MLIKLFYLGRVIQHAFNFTQKPRNFYRFGIVFIAACGKCFFAVSGRGEAFKSGGRVVKNVTGYDLCKLLSGSYGTLAVMTDVTLKVLPRPEKTRTVMIFGQDELV